MGRKLDALLGRAWRKPAKLKTFLGLTVARLAVLKNQHTARCNLARSDVAQMLILGQQDRALIRAKQVIREQNMLDAFALVECYCHLLTERAVLLDHQTECPDELREAISSLVFAGSRCGDLPELHKLRQVFSAMFGREFTVAAVELRNNCGVNPKMIQKLSTRQPSLESRERIAREIAAEKGIAVEIKIDEPSSTPEITEVDPNSSQKKQNPVVAGPPVDSPHSFAPLDHRYKDVASAAQAAFESAEYAAAAARAAVELSRSESQGKGSSSGHHRRWPHLVKDDESSEEISDEKDDRKFSRGSKLEGEMKVEPVRNYSSESESESESEEEPSKDDLIHPEVPLHEKKASSLGYRKNALFDNSDTGKEKAFDTDSDEGSFDKHEDTYLPPYHKRDHVGWYTHNLKGPNYKGIGEMGLETRNENYAAPYYFSGRSLAENINLDSMKQPQDSKVVNRAVSVRTRRGL